MQIVNGFFSSFIDRLFLMKINKYITTAKIKNLAPNHTLTYPACNLIATPRGESE